MSSITLIDGGLGQEIYRRSRKPAHPLWSLQVMQDQPEIVREVHEAFIHAGSRILTLNTYTATPTRLRRDGDPALIEPLHRLAFDLADAARARSGMPHGQVQLAGCLPPLAGSYSPESRLPRGEALAEYRRLVELQPRVDLFICETLPSIEEAEVAAQAASESGKPVLVSFTLDDSRPTRLRSGEPVSEAGVAMKPFRLAGLLLNCSTPEAISAALPTLANAGFPYGAYANAFESVDALKPGGTVDVLHARRDLGPDAYARKALAWVESGATVVGGCCEVTPEHISALDQLLKAKGFKPDKLAVLS